MGKYSRQRKESKMSSMNILFIGEFMRSTFTKGKLGDKQFTKTGSFARQLLLPL